MLCRLSANQPAMSRYPLTVHAPRPATNNARWVAAMRAFGNWNWH